MNALLLTLTLAQVTVGNAPTVAPVPVSVPEQAVTTEVRVARGLIVSQAALSMVDLGVTEYLLGSGLAREANPVLTGLSRNPFRFSAVKAGATALSTYVFVKMHRKNPRLVLVCAGALTALYGWVVHHNYGEWQKVKGR